MTNFKIISRWRKFRCISIEDAEVYIHIPFTEKIIDKKCIKYFMEFVRKKLIFVLKCLFLNNNKKMRCLKWHHINTTHNNNGNKIAKKMLLQISCENR